MATNGTMVGDTLRETYRIGEKKKEVRNIICERDV